MTTVPPHLDILSHLPAVFAAHQEMLEGIATGNVEKVRTGVERHTEIVLSHLETEILAKAEREKTMRGIKKRMTSGTPFIDNRGKRE
jgi:hypothetical protein